MKRRNKHYVYIVECRNGSYYTGYAKDINKRIEIHNRGLGAKYLRGKLPVRLVYSKEYPYYQDALKAENSLKKLTRKQKQDLIQIFNQSIVNDQIDKK